MTKFRDDWVKIVDFLIKAYFCLSPDLHGSDCRINAFTINGHDVKKFHNDWVKIVDFLIKAYFCHSLR